MSIMHETKLITVLLTITLLSGITLASTKASADAEVIDQVSLTVPIACTMTGEGTSHTATLDPGTYSGATSSEYENGIGKTTLTAICNDDNGFSIYAIGYTGNSYDSENHTKLVGSTTGGTIATKAYASGDTTSNWSMKLTKVDNPVSGDPVTYNPENLTISTGYNTWHAVPADYTKVAEYHANTGSSTTDTTLGVKLETTYAAYISSSQPADTYVGQVKYTMVHPYTEEPLQPQTTASGKICYYPNGSNVDGTMGCQNVASTVTLLASNFSRSGYGFAGWSDKFDYDTNPTQEGIKFYGPQETIALNAVDYTGDGKGLSLYAVWVKSQGSIQDQERVASVCNSLTTTPTNGAANLASVSALTDQRDNNTYAIAKLADNKCWMIENLRLENSSTNNINGSLAQGYSISTFYGNFSGLAEPEYDDFTDSETPNSIYYSGTQSNDALVNISVYNLPGYRFPRYNNINTSTRATYVSNQTVTSQNANIYSYGNYYTWHAAIADLTYSDTNNQSTTDTSLCPKGWHLPTGGSGNSNGVNVTGDTSTFREFYNLGYKVIDEKKTAYEDTPNNNNGSYYSSNTTNAIGKTATQALRSFPNNFLYSGSFTTSSANYRGSYGYYWSSTVGGSYFGKCLYLYNSRTFPGTYNNYKYYGQSIRCIADS